MRSKVHAAMLESLALILRPIVSLSLKCGISSAEFIEVARSLFVAVATEDYGVRGRPTNISRVAAMTGISRKEIRRYRESGNPKNWTPEMESSPAAAVLHYWHFDPDFCVSPGHPRPLNQTGERSFSELVRRYSGDIPAGALKAELERADALQDKPDGQFVAIKRHLHPSSFDEDFVRRAAFSIRNLTNTISHNSQLVQREDFGPELNERLGRLERFMWADDINDEVKADFRNWVRREGAEFIERADSWIGERELPKSDQVAGSTIGVGVYYFEESD
jgi:hypothetical protein